MTNYRPPLSIYFVWHPEDVETVNPLVSHCAKLLSRDINKPFSRSMNLPIFYKTSIDRSVPSPMNIRSEKTIIFVFISEEIVADENWGNYVKAIEINEETHLIPIAVDRTAYKIRADISKTNYVRLYEFALDSTKDQFFISITHEIYRFVLNETFVEIKKGKEKALKVFLSHAKEGNTGLLLAESLKQFIDNSVMNSFFDATDIAIGYEFESEIIEHIKESTVIAIQSDSYSSRYWCQRELMCAKENNRPVVVVDIIDEFEDRRFPFSSNVPGLRVHHKDKIDKNDLYRILSLTLLETVRFFYAKLILNQYKKIGWVDENSLVLSRPPEVSDILKILHQKDGQIEWISKSVIYPEPPLYSEELDYLSKLGVQLNTPLTAGFESFANSKIGVSISDITDDELINIGQGKELLIHLSQDLARHLLTRGASLIYGGDLREGGFTEFLFCEANALQARLQSEEIRIINYLAWPLYRNDTKGIISWKARYMHIADMVEVAIPKDVEPLVANTNLFIPPSNTQNQYIWSRCLTEMRVQMISNSNFRIYAGGKCSGFKGKLPGVLEEILIAAEANCPIYLMGGFGGITSRVCRVIQHNELPCELTREWQIVNNAGYNDLIDLYDRENPTSKVDFELILSKIQDIDLKNGLSDEENVILFNTPFVEEALNLVLTGINRLIKGN